MVTPISPELGLTESVARIAPIANVTGNGSNALCTQITQDGAGRIFFLAHLLASFSMKKTRTKADKAHLAAVAALPCSTCAAEGPSECHHIRDGMGIGMKASDKETIPLCYRCHRGEYGFHTLGKRRWEQTFGTQREHLAKTLALLSAAGRL